MLNFPLLSCLPINQFSGTAQACNDDKCNIERKGQREQHEDHAFGFFIKTFLFHFCLPAQLCIVSASVSVYLRRFAEAVIWSRGWQGPFQTFGAVPNLISGLNFTFHAAPDCSDEQQLTEAEQKCTDT